jgi:predicted phage tail protein
LARQKGKESLRDAVGRLNADLGIQLREVWRRAQSDIQAAQGMNNGHHQGRAHCHAVEENLAGLIADEEKGSRFSALDLFILSAVAALHDVGKVGDRPGDHGLLSFEELRERASIYGLTHSQAEAISWVVLPHNDKSLDAVPMQPYPVGGAQEADLRPLAALLALADTLHCDESRIGAQASGIAGLDPEADPKTLFRLRGRGWRYDAQDRIEIVTVSKRQQDLAVIFKGFALMQREVEPIAPVLRDAGLPWELALFVESADLERHARAEFGAKARQEYAFPGMAHYILADAARFKGRDGEAEALWQQVMAHPLSLLVGESGVGKTSLIHAGLFPRVLPGWRTVSARPYGDPDAHLVAALWEQVYQRQAPDGLELVDALAQIDRDLADYGAVIVLDQFEDIADAPDAARLAGLRRALWAVQADRFRRLHLLASYRADAEGKVGPFLQDVSGSSHGLPKVYLQPLSREGARQALDAGFAEAQVGLLRRQLLDLVAEELEIQTPGRGVYPPYVQMVSETLCRLGREGRDSIVTEELYQEISRCPGIIGNYLIRRLESFGPNREAAQRILVALTRSSGRKDQRSLEQIQSKTGLDATCLAPLLKRLVDERMIRPLGAGEYEIIHDHLGAGVIQAMSDGERELKALRELLELRVRAFVTHHSLLHTDDLARLYRVRARLAPDDEALQLLLHSNYAGRGPARYWLRHTSRERLVNLVRKALESPWADVRQAAAQALAALDAREEIPDLREMLRDGDEDVRQAAVQALAALWGREAIPDLREMLRDGHWRVRQAAVQALAALDAREEIPDLREMLRDGDEDVRQAAAQALAALWGREAIPDLREMLRDGDEDVRQAAVQALETVVAEEDLDWLAEMVGHYPYSPAGESANQLLITLDRKLYAPTELARDQEERAP